MTTSISRTETRCADDRTTDNVLFTTYDTERRCVDACIARLFRVPFIASHYAYCACMCVCVYVFLPIKFGRLSLCFAFVAGIAIRGSSFIKEVHE